MKQGHVMSVTLIKFNAWHKSQRETVEVLSSKSRSRTPGFAQAHLKICQANKVLLCHASCRTSFATLSSDVLLTYDLCLKIPTVLFISNDDLYIDGTL